MFVKRTIPDACLGFTLQVAFSRACLKVSSAAFNLKGMQKKKMSENNQANEMITRSKLLLTAPAGGFYSLSSTAP